MGIPLLEARNLEIELDKDRSLIVDFTLGIGEAIKVSGTSGSGKTTLLRTLARLTLKQSGEISFLGQGSPSISPPKWRRQICYLAQTPKMLPGTVEDNFKIPTGFRSADGKIFSRLKAAELLELLGLPSKLMETDAAVLSGGEAARVALARALINQPNVILADELTAPLDEENALRVVNLLEEWLHKDKRGLVVVAHQSSVWDRIINKTTDIDKFIRHT